MSGRKDKNTVDYFPHYCISGKTMFIIESTFGHLGYSIWFKTLELLGISENHYIDLRNETDKLYLISKLKITEDQFNNIYNLLAKIDAIDKDFWDKKIIYSENFVKNVEDAYKRRSNKCMHKCDLCKHIFNLCKQKPLNCKHKCTEYSKEKDIKVNNIYRSFDHLEITNEENEQLIKIGYNQNQIDSIYDSIQNYKDNKKYKSLFLTAKKWLEKENKQPKKELNILETQALKTKEKLDKLYATDK
jgi:CRISPR/Cas system-associated protein endoribonuclease Cas2